MKKALSTLISLSFVLVLAACGDPGEFEDPNSFDEGPQDQLQRQDNGMGGGDDR